MLPMPAAYYMDVRRKITSRQVPYDRLSILNLSPTRPDRRRLPDFIIGGARKSGTTSLWHYLNAHPDVGMASIKEPKFFTEVRGRNAGAEDPAPPSSGSFARGVEWYMDLFHGHEEKHARGEASTAYLDAPDAPRLIADYLPSIRLIFCLRHPVDRIYSHYWHERRYDSSLPEFDTMLEQNHPRMTWYIDQTHYAQHLERYRRVFDDKQLMYVLSENLAHMREATLESVLDFLGLDAGRLPPIPVGRHNTASVTHWPGLHRFLAHHRSDWTRPLPRSLANRARRLKRWVIQTNMSRVEYPPLSARTRSLLAETFEEDIRYLERLLDRDLSGWRC